MKIRPAPSLAACAALLGLSAFAEATPTFFGHTVEVTYEFPVLGTLYGPPAFPLVGSGTELFNFALFADIDISDNQILITTTRNAGINAVPFDGFHFSDFSFTIPAFLTVSLNASTTYAGFDASRLSFDADNIYLNVANLPGLRGQVIAIDVNSAGPEAVPEPSTLALLGAGLVAAARRLRPGPR